MKLTRCCIIASCSSFRCATHLIENIYTIEFKPCTPAALMCMNTLESYTTILPQWCIEALLLKRSRPKRCQGA